MKDKHGHEIRRVTIVGTGVIGTGWAAHFLARGLDVIATDPQAGAEEKLRAAIEKLWPVLERFGLARGASPERLAFTPNLDESLVDTGFVQESTPEDLEQKQRLMHAIDAAAPLNVVVASSSSGLLPTDLQATCERDPGRILVGHPFHPPHLMPLVEVVGGAKTRASAIESTMAFYRAVGKRPIHIRKELPGYIANRLQAALWREAFFLVGDGAATVEDVDTAIMHGPGLRWALLGPFLTLHLTGGSGGMASILERMGPSMQAWWDGFVTPRLDAALCESVVNGVRAFVEQTEADTLEVRRDELLIALLALKAEHKSL